MPNHITNAIWVEDFDGNISADALDKYIGEHGIIDFNKVIEMPEEIVNTTAPSANIDLIKKYGYSNWYDWAYAKWGTKWNAYDGQEAHPVHDAVHECVLVFDTAWGTPQEVLQEISRQLPLTQRLQVLYADEDIGQNCGRMTIANGVILELPIPVEFETSEDFAFWMKGYSKEEALEIKAEWAEYADD